MSKTNKKYASERMKTNNPMKRAEVREKVSTTLRIMNWKPKVRGGNGKGPTPAQLLLASSLGWDMEYVVCTGHYRDGSGYPTNYKIDIANPTLKIAIEVDGFSHGTIKRKMQDMKKEEFLTGLGWKVLRFKNKEILENLSDCLEKIQSMI